MTQTHGFTLVEERDVPEINTVAKLYRHDRTGAEVLSLINDDDNKSFLVGFQTPPPDSTGLPHILEHSVLCGSRKYPVKDPFVQLLKTSLKTFLNAITFSDMTIYPVASTNLRDYYNLVDVYLDAVFYPLITPETLMQEGWHYESNGDDNSLIYKGVVFNEMKAAYSSPDRVMNEAVDRALMPDTPYALSSGGDPAVMPNLTYEQFKKFHETLYHPSNARIVFYGDDNPEERLRLINEFLADFERIEVDASLPLQAPFDSPRRVVETYDGGDANGDSNKSMVVVRWLLPEITDQQLTMELYVLSHVLTGTQASPLRKALIDSGLGEDVIGAGLDTYRRQMSYGAGMKNILFTDADAVEALILETLQHLAEHGVDSETVEASLNTIEFSLRERNSGGFPRGLMTSLGALPNWMHGGNPLDALSFEKELESIKQGYAKDDHYFENMIRKYLLDNPHRVTVVLRPDPEVGTARNEREKDRLAKAREAMSEEEYQQVLETQEKLRILQETPDKPEDLAKVPYLTLDDIDREVKIVPRDVIEQDGATITYHEQPTSGIVYFDLGFNLRALPAQYLPYVELLAAAMTKMGTEAQDYVALTQRIGSKTGGVGATTFTASMRDGSEDFLASFMVRGKAMQEQTGELLDIVRDMLLTVNLDDKDRFKQILLERKARTERAMPMMGHSIADSRVRAQLSLPDWADEQMGGVVAYFHVRDLVEKIDTDWNEISSALKFVRDTVVNRSTAVVNVTAEADSWQQFKPQLDAFLGTLPTREFIQQTWEIGEHPRYEGLTLPLQVNFNAKGANLYEQGYELHGSQSVIIKHMNMDYMWQKIRVQGGAYGGRAGMSAGSGVLTFLSWRDPNITGTLRNFDEAARYLHSLELNDEELQNAIIGAIGSLDAYQLPDAKGFQSFVRYLVGYTDEQRQQYRDEVLATSPEDFQKFGEMLTKVAEVGRVAVVGSPDAIAAADQELGNVMTVTKLD